MSRPAESAVCFYDWTEVLIMRSSRKRADGEAVVSRQDNDKDFLMPATTGDNNYDEGGNLDGEGWADSEEMEDFTHMPYPAVWNYDPDDQVVHAAMMWQRAVELLAEQGYAPDECEAEILRRCAKVPRRVRAIMERIERDEAEYAELAADETLCEWPWGRLCPEHGNMLVDTRRGTTCPHEGCTRRWPRGDWKKHCDLPAAVITKSTMKKSGEWRLCAGHRRMFPKGELLRILPTATGEPGVDPAAEIGLPDTDA
jgi:hypothetical protein